MCMCLKSEINGYFEPLQRVLVVVGERGGRVHAEEARRTLGTRSMASVHEWVCVCF